MKSKAFRMVALLSAFAMSLLVSGCVNSWGRNEPTPIRNCQQEYNRLAAEEFHSLRDAKAAMRNFLADFDDPEQCTECRDNVEQMKTEFNAMDELFANVDRNAPKERYRAFISMVKSNDNRFSGSSFEAVRETWQYLKEEKKADYIKERVDLIDEDEFSNYLMNFAKDLAEQWYGGRKMEVVDKDCYILYNQVEITQVEGKAAKRGTCVVHVRMKGAWGGLRKGDVEICVQGTLGVTESNCNVVFAKGSYEKTKSEGALKRIDETGLMAVFKAVVETVIDYIIL